MKRICKKCGGEKEIGEFTIDRKCRLGHTWACKECKAKHSKTYRQIPINKARIKARKRKINNKPQHKEYRRKYKKTDKYKKYSHKYNKNNTATLHDNYIKTLIWHRTGLSFSDITLEMVELKRMQLKFHREIKKGKEAINEIHNNVRVNF